MVVGTTPILTHPGTTSFLLYIMSQDLFTSVWKSQSAVLKALRSALPEGLDLYAGGTGNRRFEDKLDLTTGFWRGDTGQVRWIFHVVPDGNAFKVHLPPRAGATDLPGGMNTIGTPPKALLTYIAVALVQKADGSFEWPVGWQWIVFFSLEDEVPPNTSAKIHKLHAAEGTLRADRNIISLADWGVLGVLPSTAAHHSDAFGSPLTYGSVGQAIANCISALTPT